MTPEKHWHSAVRRSVWGLETQIARAHGEKYKDILEWVKRPHFRKLAAIYQRYSESESER